MNRSADAVAPFDDPAALAPPRVLREDLADGSFVLRHPDPLQPHARCIGDWLDHWAQTTPEALFLAEREADGSAGWRRLSYAQTREQVGRIAQSLLDLALDPARPVVVLSDNAIDHALLALAALHLGRAVCVVSSAYCRLTTDYAKVSGILDTLDPALVYASDAAVYGPPIAAWQAGARAASTTRIVLGRNTAGFAGALSFDALLDKLETAAVDRAFAAIRPGDAARYLLTSGSTGTPKVVVNTHRMLTANQQQIAQVWPFLERHRLVLLEWLPWSHTFGANHNFNMALAHGGALYLDDGRPAPGLIERTVANLREVRPNFYFNVPRGFDMLLPTLEADDGFARAFFERLEGLFYAGAALPQSSWERLQAVARRVRSRPVWFTSAWGSTETSPALTSVHWPLERAGCIGLPLPGVALKFVPTAGKLELRARGPNVFSHYRNAPELSAQAFDSDGYYRMGDAGRLADAARPERGVVFDGRVAEDFKLASGTWVSVGTLRLRAVSALAPLAADVVVAGHDRDEIGLLVFPSAAAAQLDTAALRLALARGLAALRDGAAGSSQVPTRLLVLDEPPNADAGEITDKGYINQRAVLTRRAAWTQRLYGTDADVVTA